MKKNSSNFNTNNTGIPSGFLPKANMGSSSQAQPKNQGKVFQKKAAPAPALVDPLPQELYPVHPSSASRPSTTSRLVPRKKVETNKLIPLKAETNGNVVIPPDNYRADLEDDSRLVGASIEDTSVLNSPSPELDNPPFLRSTEFLINLLLKQSSNEEKDRKLKKRWNSRFHLDKFLPQYDVERDRFAKTYLQSPLFIPIGKGKKGASSREKEIERLVKHANELLNWVQNSGNKKKNLGIVREMINKTTNLQPYETEKFLTLLSNAPKLSSEQFKPRSATAQGTELHQIEKEQQFYSETRPHQPKKPQPLYQEEEEYYEVHQHPQEQEEEEEEEEEEQKEIDRHTHHRHHRHHRHHKDEQDYNNQDEDEDDGRGYTQQPDFGPDVYPDMAEPDPNAAVFGSAREKHTQPFLVGSGEDIERNTKQRPKSGIYPNSSGRSRTSQSRNNNKYFVNEAKIEQLKQVYGGKPFKLPEKQAGLFGNPEDEEVQFQMQLQQKISQQENNAQVEENANYEYYQTQQHIKPNQQFSVEIKPNQNNGNSGTFNNRDERIRDLYEKTKTRIEKLWKELRISEDECEIFRRINFTQPPTLDHLSMLGHEIENLREHKRTTLKVLKQIEKREEKISQISHFVMDFRKHHERRQAQLRNAQTDEEKTDIEKKIEESNQLMKKYIQELILRYRLDSLDVVESILKWRNGLSVPKPFMWKKTDYLIKMQDDIDFFLEYKPVVDLFDEILIRYKKNPLLLANRTKQSVVSPPHDTTKDHPNPLASSGTPVMKRKNQIPAPGPGMGNDGMEFLDKTIQKFQEMPSSTSFLTAKEKAYLAKNLPPIQDELEKKRKTAAPQETTINNATSTLLAQKLQPTPRDPFKERLIAADRIIFAEKTIIHNYLESKKTNQFAPTLKCMIPGCFDFSKDESFAKEVDLYFQTKNSEAKREILSKKLMALESRRVLKLQSTARRDEKYLHFKNLIQNTIALQSLKNRNYVRELQNLPIVMTQDMWQLLAKIPDASQAQNNKKFKLTKEEAIQANVELPFTSKNKLNQLSGSKRIEKQGIAGSKIDELIENLYKPKPTSSISKTHEIAIGDDAELLNSVEKDELKELSGITELNLNLNNSLEKSGSSLDLSLSMEKSKEREIEQVKVETENDSDDLVIAKNLLPPLPSKISQKAGIAEDITISAEMENEQQKGVPSIEDISPITSPVRKDNEESMLQSPEKQDQSSLDISKEQASPSKSIFDIDSGEKSKLEEEQTQAKNPVSIFTEEIIAVQQVEEQTKTVQEEEKQEVPVLVGEQNEKDEQIQRNVDISITSPAKSESKEESKPEESKPEESKEEKITIAIIPPKLEEEHQQNTDIPFQQEISAQSKEETKEEPTQSLFHEVIIENEFALKESLKEENDSEEQADISIIEPVVESRADNSDISFNENEGQQEELEEGLEKNSEEKEQIPLEDGIEPQQIPTSPQLESEGEKIMAHPLFSPLAASESRIFEEASMQLKEDEEKSRIIEDLFIEEVYDEEELAKRKQEKEEARLMRSLFSEEIVEDAAEKVFLDSIRVFSTKAETVRTSQIEKRVVEDISERPAWLVDEGLEYIEKLLEMEQEISAAYAKNLPKTREAIQAMYAKMSAGDIVKRIQALIRRFIARRRVKQLRDLVFAKIRDEIEDEEKKYMGAVKFQSLFRGLVAKKAKKELQMQRELQRILLAQQEETEKKMQEEAERKMQEETERKMQEETERKMQEEKERKMQEEAERKIQEEAERKMQEARNLKEEQEMKELELEFEQTLISQSQQLPSEPQLLYFCESLIEDLISMAQDAEQISIMPENEEISQHFDESIIDHDQNFLSPVKLIANGMDWIKSPQQILTPQKPHIVQEVDEEELAEAEKRKQASIIRVQCLIRRFLARNRVRKLKELFVEVLQKEIEEEEKQYNSVVHIQSAFKGFKTRKEIKNSPRSISKKEEEIPFKKAEISTEKLEQITIDFEAREKLKEKIKDRIKEKIKEEMKEEIRRQVLEGLKHVLGSQEEEKSANQIRIAQVKVDLREDIKTAFQEEMMKIAALNKEMTNKLREQLKKAMKEELRKELRDEIGQEMRKELEMHLKDLRINNSTSESIQTQVEEAILEQIFKPSVTRKRLPSAKKRRTISKSPTPQISEPDRSPEALETKTEKEDYEGVSEPDSQEDESEEESEEEYEDEIEDQDQETGQSGPLEDEDEIEDELKNLEKHPEIVEVKEKIGEIEGQIQEIQKKLQEEETNQNDKIPDSQKLVEIIASSKETEKMKEIQQKIIEIQKKIEERVPDLGEQHSEKKISDIQVQKEELLKQKQEIEKVLEEGTFTKIGEDKSPEGNHEIPVLEHISQQIVLEEMKKSIEEKQMAIETAKQQNSESVLEAKTKIDDIKEKIAQAQQTIEKETEKQIEKQVEKQIENETLQEEKKQIVGEISSIIEEKIPELTAKIEEISKEIEELSSEFNEIKPKPLQNLQHPSLSLFEEVIENLVSVNIKEKEEEISKKTHEKNAEISTISEMLSEEKEKLQTLSEKQREIEKKQENIEKAPIFEEASAEIVQKKQELDKLTQEMKLLDEVLEQKTEEETKIQEEEKKLEGEKKEFVAKVEEIQMKKKELKEKTKKTKNLHSSSKQTEELEQEIATIEQKIEEKAKEPQEPISDRKILQNNEEIRSRLQEIQQEVEIQAPQLSYLLPENSNPEESDCKDSSVEKQGIVPISEKLALVSSKISEKLAEIEQKIEVFKQEEELKAIAQIKAPNGETIELFEQIIENSLIFKDKQEEITKYVEEKKKLEEILEKNKELQEIIVSSISEVKTELETKKKEEIEDLLEMKQELSAKVQLIMEIEEEKRIAEVEQEVIEKLKEIDQKLQIIAKIEAEADPKEEKEAILEQISAINEKFPTISEKIEEIDRKLSEIEENSQPSSIQTSSSKKIELLEDIIENSISKKQLMKKKEELKEIIQKKQELDEILKIKASQIKKTEDFEEAPEKQEQKKALDDLINKKQELGQVLHEKIEEKKAEILERKITETLKKNSVEILEVESKIADISKKLEEEEFEQTQKIEELEENMKKLEETKQEIQETEMKIEEKLAEIEKKTGESGVFGGKTDIEEILKQKIEEIEQKIEHETKVSVQIVQIKTKNENLRIFEEIIEDLIHNKQNIEANKQKVDELNEKKQKLVQILSENMQQIEELKNLVVEKEKKQQEMQSIGKTVQETQENVENLAKSMEQKEKLQEKEEILQKKEELKAELQKKKHVQTIEFKKLEAVLDKKRKRINSQTPLSPQNAVEIPPKKEVDVGKSVIRVQALIRKFIAKRRVKKLQKLVKEALEKQILEEERKYFSVVKIQSCVRKWRDAKRVRALKEEKDLELEMFLEEEEFDYMAKTKDARYLSDLASRIYKELEDNDELNL